MKAIALCHNVTPVYESQAGVTGETESAEADQDFSDENRTYQASSPDEVSRAPWRLLLQEMVSYGAEPCGLCVLALSGMGSKGWVPASAPALSAEVRTVCLVSACTLWS